MALKVIGAGLGRTGTLSLKLALEELGFDKCYHMYEVIAHPEDIAVWEAAGRGEPVDWEALFQGYQATVDWPSCNFYAELLKLYPDAKVVLTVRDPERWYESALRTIYHVRTAFPAWLPGPPKMRRLMKMTNQLIWDGFFRGRFAEKDHALAAFNRHNEEVKRTVPPEKLLVFEVREGWAPLCAFLGVPVPEDRPFPKVNDAEDFRARIRKVTTIARAAPVVGLVVTVLVMAWVFSRFLNP